MKHLLTFFALLCVNNQLFSQSVARENEKQSLIRKINDIQKTPDNLLDPKKVAALNTQLEQSRGLFFNDNQTLDQLETSLKELSKRALPVAEKMRDAKQKLERETRKEQLKNEQKLRDITDAIESLEYTPALDFFDPEKGALKIRLLTKTKSDLNESQALLSKKEFNRLSAIIEKTEQRMQDYQTTQMAEHQTFAIGDMDTKEKNKETTEIKPTVITLDNKDKEIQNIKDQMAQQSSVEERWNILIDTICASDAAFVKQLEKDSKMATDLALGIFKNGKSLAQANYKEVQSYAKARNAYDRAVKKSSIKNIQGFWEALDFTGYQVSRIGRFIRKVTGTLKPQDYSRYLMEARNPGQLVYWLEKGGNQITKADRTIAIDTMISNAIAKNDMQSLKDLKYFAEHTSSGDTVERTATQKKGGVTVRIPDLFLSQKQTDRLNKALNITSTPETTATNKPVDKKRPSSAGPQERDTREEPRSGSQERRMSLK